MPLNVNSQVQPAFSWNEVGEYYLLPTQCQGFNNNWQLFCLIYFSQQVFD
jgi:hypothetical protein